MRFSNNKTFLKPILAKIYFNRLLSVSHDWSVKLASCVHTLMHTHKWKGHYITLAQLNSLTP